MKNEVSTLLEKSAFAESNSIHDTSYLIGWLKKKGKESKGYTKKVALIDLDNWNYRDDGIILRPNSGKFFRIISLRIHTNYGSTSTWCQPIIQQSDIGILGIITKVIDGTLYFLMQAKEEPGNINAVQLSPTLQATKSNFTQMHGGFRPYYLDYFWRKEKFPVLVDRLQSEHGSIFLKKRNRNMVIFLEEPIEEKEDFRWMTLGQIKKICEEDNLVNMDTRTVISVLPLFGDGHNTSSNKIKNIGRGIEDSFKREFFLSTYGGQKPLHPNQEVMSWFTDLKFKYYIEQEQIQLSELEMWRLGDKTIDHIDNRHFRVIGVDVRIDGREVESWSQPLIEPINRGLCALVTKNINGVYHFLIQGKVECGNLDIVELAPTLQCTIHTDIDQDSPPFLNLVLNADENQIRFDSNLSEEGGRFFHNQNRYMIVESEENLELPESGEFIWMSLQQIEMFLQFSNGVNIHTRSLLACVSYT